MIPFPFQAGQLGVSTQPQDRLFSNVVFLANYNTGLVDHKGKTITATGNPTVNSTNPFAGGSSVKFDGTTPASLTLADSTDWTFTTAGFCVEGWVYRETGGDTTIGICNFGGVSGLTWQSIGIYADTNNIRVLVTSNASTGTVVFPDSSFGTLTRDVWNHYALTWDGTTYRAFLNGTSGATATTSTAPYDPGFGVLFGSYPFTTWNSNLASLLKGSIGPTRITKGNARYTSNFTVKQELFPTS